MRTDTTFAIYATILMIFIWKQSGTSHGKSACGGIGGTVKRPASKASLKRPAHNQIWTCSATVSLMSLGPSFSIYHPPPLKTM